MNYNLFSPLLCVTTLSMYSASAHSDKPNIVLIISDDQGYGDFSRYNQQQVETPNLDRLCEESRYFSNFYCPYIGREHTLLPELLKEAGYSTALIGKWHSGKGPGFIPQQNV